MNKHLIPEWFFDNFCNIIDELVMIRDLKNTILDENDEEFHDEILHQSYDEFKRSISISCATQLGLSYEEVFDTLEDRLEELYYGFD